MASRYLVSGGDLNFGSTSNWSATDGGASGATVPTSGDDVFLTGNSPSGLVINASNRTILSLTTTGFMGTVTMTFNLTVSGPITLSAGAVFSGAGKLESATGSTHTSNGAAVSNFGLRGSTTHTLGDNWTVGNLILGSSSNATVINGNQISITGNLDLSLSVSGSHSGTTQLVMTGTGNISYPTTTGTLQLSLAFNTSGTITFASGTFRYGGGTLQHVSGTLNVSSATLSIAAAGTTIDLPSSAVWAALASGATSGTVTLSRDLYTSGLYTHSSSSQAVTWSGNKIYIGGGLFLSASSGSITGTSELVLTGTGSITSDSTGQIQNDITIDAGSGTITITDPATGTSDPPLVRFNRVKYASGTVVTDRGTWAKGGIPRLAGCGGGLVA